MFDFNFGKKTAIGVDIGSSSIKAVELTLKKGKPRLTNYAWMDVPAMEQKKGENQSFFETLSSEYIKRIFKIAKFRSKKVFFSVPSFDGLVTLIDFPEMPQEEIDQAIKFEAQKYIPMSLDDVVLSWQILDGLAGSEKKESPDKTSQAKKNKILLVAFSKNKAQEYGRIAKNANLDLSGIEIETVAMLNSLIGHDRGSFLIADIGYRVCNIILVKQGVIEVNRNIDAGGDDITVAVARAMGIAENRAEDIKLSGKNFFAADSNAHLSTIDIVAGELARIINSNKDIQLDSIILSGGTAKLAGFAQYLEAKFGKKVIVGNPFGRIDCSGANETAVKSIAPRFSVAAGMALLGIEKLAKK